MTDRQKMREAAEKAKDAGKGVWEHDCERQTDAPYRHHEFFVVDGNGSRMFGSENCDGSFGLIESDYDDYGGNAWNEPARRVIEHTVASQPVNVLALLDRLDSVEGMLRRAETALYEVIGCEDGTFSPDEKYLAIRLCRTVATEIEEMINDRQ